jgi:hypothetical protein
MQNAKCKMQNGNQFSKFCILHFALLKNIQKFVEQLVSRMKSAQITGFYPDIC